MERHNNNPFKDSKGKDKKVYVTFNGRATKHIITSPKLYGLTNGETIEILRNFLLFLSNTVKVFLNDDEVMTIEFEYLARCVEDVMSDSPLLKSHIIYNDGWADYAEELERYANMVHWHLSGLVWENNYNHNWYLSK